MLKLISLAVLVLLAGCGNPVTLKEELNDERQQKRAADARAQASEHDARRMKGLLTDLVISKSNIWLQVDFGDYPTAQKACADIGYALPDQAAFDEFLAGPYTADPRWQRFSPDEFHILDKTPTLKNGWALCRLPIKV